MATVRPFEFLPVESASQGDSGQASDLASWVVDRAEQPALCAAPFVNLDAPEQPVADSSHLAKMEEEARAAARAEGHAEGLAQGNEEGLAQGRAAAEEELDAAKGALVEATEQLTGARVALAEVHELDMAEIALGLAAELAGGAIAIEPERVAALARKAVSILAEADSITLRTTPALLPVLQEATASIGSLSSAASVTVVGDQALEGDACIVEADLARVDLRVEQRLAGARDLLATARGEG